MKLRTLALASLMAFSGLSMANPINTISYDGVSTVDLAQLGESTAQNLHWVSVDELKYELSNKEPMAVGFDIDDTILFSSVGFAYGAQHYKDKDGKSYLHQQKFWNDMNCKLENFSMLKETTAKIVKMHQEHGDTIYFITNRTAPKGCGEITTRILNGFLGSKGIQPVIFAGTSKDHNTKTKYIKELNIKRFYGDSDSDIKAANGAGVEGIRIMRNSQSSYKPIPKNGQYGERIVEDSQY